MSIKLKQNKMKKFETIPDTEMQIDTVNPGKFEWKSFWKPDLGNYTGTYFDNRQKDIESSITSNTGMFGTSIMGPVTSKDPVLRLNVKDAVVDKVNRAQNDTRTAEEVDESYYKNVTAFLKARDDFEQAVKNAVQRIKDVVDDDE